MFMFKTGLQRKWQDKSCGRTPAGIEVVSSRRSVGKNDSITAPVRVAIDRGICCDRGNKQPRQHPG